MFYSLGHSDVVVTAQRRAFVFYQPVFCVTNDHLADILLILSRSFQLLFQILRYHGATLYNIRINVCEVIEF